NGLQNHLGGDCPIHGTTHTSWTPKPDSGQLTDGNPSVPHSVPRLPRMAQGHSGDIRRQSPGVGADGHLWFVGAGMAYRYSACPLIPSTGRCWYTYCMSRRNFLGGTNLA